MTGTDQEFDTLAAALADAGSPIGPAELHGVVCGVLCAGGPDAARAWLERNLAECDSTADAEEFRAPFRALQLESWRSLAAADMEFRPLLPGDEHALPQRVRALASWCDGFVGGLALGGLRLDGDAPNDSGELTEIIEDFIEISKAAIEPDAQSDAEAAEFSFAEIAEFVRVAVQIVFEEIGRRRGSDGQRIH